MRLSNTECDAGVMVTTALHSEMTVTAPYREELYTALLQMSDNSATWEGFDGRTYWSFEGDEGWRVVLVGKFFPQEARYR